MKLRVGTRGSALARAQTMDMVRLLEGLGHEVEVIIIKTQGDQNQTQAFAQVGATGIFVRELEVALLDRRIDLAVHSYKDLTSKGPDGLCIAAVPERVSPEDRLCLTEAAHDPEAGLIPLKQGLNVGTASARRAALLRHLRPDLKVSLLRGNVPRRVQRLVDGDYDAILLAAAGLDRLARAGQAVAPEGVLTLDLDPSRFIPAPSQGALALQTRVGGPAQEAVGALNDPDASTPVQAERKLQALIEGGCQLPLGAWCQGEEGGKLTLRAFMEVDGVCRFAEAAGPEPMALAEAVFAQLGASP